MGNVPVDLRNPKTGRPEIDENPELFRLMSFALEQACGEVARTGEQHPSAVIETPSGVRVQGFKAKESRLEMEYEDARRALLNAPSEAKRYALTWAGYLTIGGVRYEAVMVGGGERGKARGLMMGQRYKQHLPETKFESIGNPAILGPGDNLLTMAGDPEAVSRLKPVFERIVADVDHDQAGNADAPPYEFRMCPELNLSFGNLDLPFRKELQKKPDMVHVIMKRQTWITVFKPDAKEVFLDRSTLYPIQGAGPFPGFVEDGVIMIGYLPPPPTGNGAPAVGLFVLWMAAFKVTGKSQIASGVDR